MNDQPFKTLEIVMATISAHLASGASEMPRAILEYIHRILAWILAQAAVHDEQDAIAIAARHDLVPQIQGLLGEEAGDTVPGNETAPYIAKDTVARLTLWPTHDPKASTAQDLLWKMLNVDRQKQSCLLLAYEERMNTLAPAQGKSGGLSEESTARLSGWLRHIFPGNDHIAIRNVQAVPGGFAKETFFLSLAHAVGLPSELVIRLDWANAPGGNSVVDEFHIIRTLHDAGLAVPKPYALEATGAILDSPFLLLERVQGKVVGDVLDVKDGSRAFALSLARTLATMHAVPVSAFGNAIPGAREPSSIRLGREMDGFETAWRGIGTPSVPLETAFTWLRANIHLADGPPALIHKDVGCHNILVANDTVAALLDWETAAIGTPAQDIGYVFPLVTQMMDWTAFIDAYVEAGGAAPNQASIDYHCLWGYTWLTVLAMQARAAFLSGKARDIGIAYASSCLLDRFQARLSNQLLSILASAEKGPHVAQ